MLPCYIIKTPKLSSSIIILQGSSILLSSIWWTIQYANSHPSKPRYNWWPKVVFLMLTKEICFNFGSFDGSFDCNTWLDESPPVQVSPWQVSSLPLSVWLPTHEPLTGLWPVVARRRSTDGCIRASCSQWLCGSSESSHLLRADTPLMEFVYICIHL